MLLVDKASESSSHDIVLAARRVLKVKRIGHTGTLDPFATGLLLLLLGSLTRLAELFHVLPKTYVATMALGRETDTDDLTGETTREYEGWEDLDAERVAAALSAHLGSSLQVPSMYSAKRVGGGKRAYQVARAGGAVELEGSPITIHSVRLDSMERGRVRFEACVSTGTYMRALARDLGRDLGCGAHLVDLRRTAIGPFEVRDAIASDRISRDAIRSETAFRSGGEIVPWLPSRTLDAEDRLAVLQGRSIPCGELSAPAWSPNGGLDVAADLVALTEEETLVAIAERNGDALSPRKVFAG